MGAGPARHSFGRASRMRLLRECGGQTPNKAEILTMGTRLFFAFCISYVHVWRRLARHCPNPITPFTSYLVRRQVVIIRESISIIAEHIKTPSLVNGQTHSSGLGEKASPRFGEFCFSSCLPLLPSHACSIHATWGPHFS